MTKTQKYYIAPSILAADIGKLAQEVDQIITAGADWVHVDVMDGTFVPPITFGDNVVRSIRAQSNIFLDVHLMIEHPELHLERFAAAGSNRIIVHQEVSPHLHRTLGEIKRLGVKAGVAINPATPIATILDALELCDLVLVMTVNPGWGGQPFIPSTIQKIAALQSEIAARNLSTIIEVDGGINSTTAPQCAAAGASAFVAGSAIFAATDRIKALNTLKESLKVV